MSSMFGRAQRGSGEVSQWSVLTGDCLTILKDCPDNYCDSLICDPPGGINFMPGQNPWDSDRGGSENWIEWLSLRLQECLRVVKPGGYAAIWSYPRTTHWTGMALEQSGWELRDQIYHCYAQGKGLGNKLKAAIEPWWLARKPFKGSTTANVEQWGTGKLNLDEVRVPRDRENDVPGWHKSGSKGSHGYLGTSTFRIRDMDAQEIQGRCGVKDRFPSHLLLGDGGVQVMEEQREGASRFFTDLDLHSPLKLVPKPTRKERELGCDDLPDSVLHRMNPGGLAEEGRFAPIAVKNNHTAVKPIALMRWVNTLITPPSGLILDPFAGSGTTGIAAILDGFSFVGIEEDPHFVEIAQARIEHWEKNGK